jgi:hypothetical protein
MMTEKKQFRNMYPLVAEVLSLVPKGRKLRNGSIGNSQCINPSTVHRSPSENKGPGMKDLVSVDRYSFRSQVVLCFRDLLRKKTNKDLLFNWYEIDRLKAGSAVNRVS